MADRHQRAVVARLQEAHAAEQAAIAQLTRRLRRARDLSDAEWLADQLVDCERRRRELSERLHALGAGPALGAVLVAVAKAALSSAGPARAATRGLGGLASTATAAGDAETVALAERHLLEWVTVG